MSSLAAQRTYSAKANDIEAKWYIIDATDIVLGRLASKVALILRGKNKPTYTPSLDCGDHVVIINADKVHLTGNKLEDKVYHYHTGFPGGIKSRTAKQINTGPFAQRIIIKAVERMITRNPLGSKQMTKLHVYAGAEHPHQGQQPVELDFANANPKNKKRK